jgi:hypothetical protein
MFKHKNRKEQRGDLVVVGSAKVVIPLLDFPHRIEVQFKRKLGPPPCDPCHHRRLDKLKYKVYRHYMSHCKNAYTLVIEWDVHDIREIFWQAYYC